MKNVLGDLERMMPAKFKKWIDWKQSKDQRRPWPRKIMVSLRFKLETGLVFMIEILKIMREEMTKANYRVNGELVKTNLEISRQKLPLRRAQGIFFRAIKEARGYESMIGFLCGSQ